MDDPTPAPAASAAAAAAGEDFGPDEGEVLEGLIEGGDLARVTEIFARRDAARMAEQQELQHGISYLTLAVYSGSLEMVELVFRRCGFGARALVHCDEGSGAPPPMQRALLNGRAEITRWCFERAGLAPDSDLYGRYAGYCFEDAWRNSPATFQALVECTSYTALAREYANYRWSARYNAEFAAWLAERAPLAASGAGWDNAA